MLAAVFRGPGELEVTDVEVPRVGSGDVLVKVGANTVCGTDLRILRGEKTKGIQRDTILGHELAGHVAEVGRNVEGYEVGAPVTMAPSISCRRCYFCTRGMENVCQNKKIVGNIVDGGLAEYMLVPSEAVEAGNLFTLEKDLPSEHVALAEPLACCINGQENYQVNLNDTILIMGAGPIGLLHLQLALLAGAKKVLVSNPSGERRRAAESFGAHITIDPEGEDLWEVVAENTDGLGVDASVICVGVPKLVNDALKVTRKGGRVNIFAGLAGDGWAQVEANLIHYNELTITGSSDSRRSDYEKAIELIQAGRIHVERMVTHRFPLRDAVAAIDTSAEGEGIKTAIIP